MSATIRRGTPARRPVVKRKQVKQPLGDRLLARLPVSEAALRRTATLMILTAGAAVVIAAAAWAGVPGMAASVFDGAAARAGLKVEQIEVTGLKRMDLMTVNAVALDQKSLAMPAVDLEGVRKRLLAYGWIRDAHVSRRLPDTLLIRIDERTPAAVWQDEGQLTLIDADGVLLEPVDARHMPSLPLVIGSGADRQEPAYQALLAAAPALRPHVRAAAWVGNRRWDRTFDSGETLMLPEGDKDAAGALAKFAEQDRVKPLLGKGWLRFDLRDPRQLVARRPGSDAQQIADPGGAAAAPAPTKVASPPGEG